MKQYFKKFHQLDGEDNGNGGGDQLPETNEPQPPMDAINEAAGDAPGTKQDEVKEDDAEVPATADAADAVEA